MFYEESMINGILHFRGTPTGEWRPVTSPVGQMVNTLATMSAEDRVRVFSLFCVYCGDEKPKTGCTCMRDD